MRHAIQGGDPSLVPFAMISRHLCLYLEWAGY